MIFSVTALIKIIVNSGVVPPARTPQIEQLSARQLKLIDDRVSRSVASPHLSTFAGSRPPPSLLQLPQGLQSLQPSVSLIHLRPDPLGFAFPFLAVTYCLPQIGQCVCSRHPELLGIKKRFACQWQGRGNPGNRVAKDRTRAAGWPVKCVNEFAKIILRLPDCQASGCLVEAWLNFRAHESGGHKTNRHYL